MDDKPTREDLIQKLPTPGWKIETGSAGFNISDTLEKLVRITHDRHADGQAPGLIKQIETGVELDAIQIAELWEHLGLPI